AAWRYFGRAPGQLSWAETAALAVLPNAPALIHPGRNRAQLLDKRNNLLDKLAATGTIDQQTANLAKLEPLPDKPHALPRLAPHLLERFQQEYPSLNLHTTRVVTTINATLQQQVAAIEDRYHGNRSANGVQDAAALVLEDETGKTLAYIGNVHSPQNG